MMSFYQFCFGFIQRQRIIFKSNAKLFNCIANDMQVHYKRYAKWCQEKQRKEKQSKENKNKQNKNKQNKMFKQFYNLTFLGIYISRVWLICVFVFVYDM